MSIAVDYLMAVSGAAAPETAIKSER